MKPEPAGFARVVNGSKIRTCWPLAARVSVKSPWRSISVGTLNVLLAKEFSRRPSYEPMKNVLSRRIGPLIVPPNWLRLKLASSTPRPLSKKLFASNAELRRNS